MLFRDESWGQSTCQQGLTIELNVAMYNPGFNHAKHIINVNILLSWIKPQEDWNRLAQKFMANYKIPVMICLWKLPYKETLLNLRLIADFTDFIFCVYILQELQLFL